MRAIPAAGVTLLLCAPAASFAAERTVTENATYVMGDNDTRAQAAELCIAKIERKALEASGALVESELEMISDEAHGGVNDTAHQRVRSYVGAVVKATATHAAFHVDGERIVVDCSATVAFDPDEVKERLRTARTDDTTKAKVDQQQERIAALEGELQDLRAKLAARPVQQVNSAANSAAGAANRLAPGAGAGAGRERPGSFRPSGGARSGGDDQLRRLYGPPAQHPTGNDGDGTGQFRG